jgi:hypothetical protein
MTRTVARSSSPQRIPREVADLIQALHRHVRLLRKYAKQAFEEGDIDYLGEVAGKLRILVLDRGRNRPLLLNLMDEFGVSIDVALNDLTTGLRMLPLEDYLDSTAFGGLTSEGYARMSHADVIAAWSQQTGAGHEDWAFEEPFARFAFSGISIGGQSAPVTVLHNITKAVLSAADDFLGWLTPEHISSHTFTSS